MAHPRPLPRRVAPLLDTGTTLVEVVTATSIMSVFLAVFTTAVLQMYGTSNATEAASTAQSQANIAFLRLDTEIRYAAAISMPGQVGGNWYVEYATTASGTSVCTELRLAAGQLQRRSWSRGSAPGAFVPLASGVTAGPSTVPFTLVSPDPSLGLQRLEISLSVVAHRSPTGQSRQVNITFTALNSSAPVSDAVDCATTGRAAP